MSALLAAVVGFGFVWSAPASQLTPVERDRLQRLFARLGSADFFERESAQAELAVAAGSLGHRAVPLVVDRMADADLEIAGRAREVLRGVIRSAPLDEFLGEADDTVRKLVMSVALDRRAPQSVRTVLSASDARFPPGLRTATVGLLTAFLDGEAEWAVSHCSFPFVRHGQEGVDRPRLLEIWRRLAPQWQSACTQVSQVEFYEPGDVGSAVDVVEPRVTLDRKDRVVVLHFHGDDAEPGTRGVRLIFVFRPVAGRWRAIAVAE